MKIELTERDKKLLTFMAVFAIVTLMGYYLIIPQIKKASEYEEQIEEQEIIQNVNDSKIGQLFLVEANNKDLEQLIEGSKENYYPIMENDEIDNLVTNTVIEKYGLTAYDLSIGGKALAGLQPYIYSKKAITGESDAKARAMNAAAPIIGEDGMPLWNEVADVDISTTGIYVVSINMRLAGPTENITRFLDDLALTQKKLRLVNYSVSTEEIIIPHDDGTEEVITNESLNISVELYMCED